MPIGSSRSGESGEANVFTWNVTTRSAGSVIIRYVDAQGDPSVREIRPIALEGEFSGKAFKARCVIAHCYSAKATRTFRVDRIQELADAKTGEVRDVNEWIGSLPMSGQPRDDVALTSSETFEIVQPRPTIPWKLLLAVLVIGYAIGRFRLIRWALHAAGKKWGLWL